MSRIRSHGTRPEQTLHQAMKRLWKTGYRYRIQHKVIGKPDFAFPREGVAIFVDGCFFHGCVEHFVLPKRNREFWQAKIIHNKKRDLKVNQELSASGWKVLRFWEHEVKRSLVRVLETIEIELEIQRSPNSANARGN